MQRSVSLNKPYLLADGGCLGLSAEWKMNRWSWNYEWSRPPTRRGLMGRHGTEPAGVAATLRRTQPSGSRQLTGTRC